jgi:hypothetical protein
MVDLRDFGNDFSLPGSAWQRTACEAPPRVFCCHVVPVCQEMPTYAATPPFRHMFRGNLLSSRARPRQLAPADAANWPKVAE